MRPSAPRSLVPQRKSSERAPPCSSALAIDRRCAGTAKGKQRFHWTLQTREAGTGVSTGRTAAMPRGEA